MRRFGCFIIAVVIALFLTGCGSDNPQSRILRIQGSTTVTPIVVDAAENFERETGIRIRVDSAGGSSGGIAAVAGSRADIGMSSRPITPHDRQKFPGITFQAAVIGYDGIAVAVNRSIARHGVTELSPSELQLIFEGKVRNWKELDGPDQQIFVYDKEPGRGTREVFDHAIWGRSLKRPAYSWRAQVGGNDESRLRIQSHKGGIGQLSVAWVKESGKLKALGIVSNQQVFLPSDTAIRSGEYPISRGLRLVTIEENESETRRFIEYILSDKGQNIVRKHGFIPVGK